MSEIPLARLWQLDDGTLCLLLKNSQTESWELRVVRQNDIIRSEHFGHPVVAMDEAKTWRLLYDSSFES